MDLGAAILVLGVLNHFIRAAELRRYVETEQLASVSQSIARAASEEHEAVNDANGTGVSPTSPRFTDFYFFATTHQTYVENVALGRAQI